MYSGISEPSRWILPDVLTEMAQCRPRIVWVQDSSGDSMTFADAESQTRKAATFFCEQGVRAGDRVGLFILNSCDFIRAWLGLGKLCATAVMFNSELRGQFLRHQLQDSAVSCIVVDAELAPAIVEVASLLPNFKTLLVVGAAKQSWRMTPGPDLWRVEPGRRTLDGS